MGYPSDQMAFSVNKVRDLVADFYVCETCGKHWGRSHAIMRQTAREGKLPRNGVVLKR